MINAGLDSSAAVEAFSDIDVSVNLAAGWAVGVALLLLSPEAISTYLAFSSLISDEVVFRSWGVCIGIAAVTCLTILYTEMPCVIGLPMRSE